MSLLAFLAAPFSFLVYLSTFLSLALLFAFLLSYLIIRVPLLCSSMCIVLLNVALSYAKLSPENVPLSLIATNDCTAEDLDAGIKDIGFSLKFSARYPGLAQTICVSLLLQNREIFARASFPKNYAVYRGQQICERIRNRKILTRTHDRRENRMKLQ